MQEGFYICVQLFTVNILKMFECFSATLTQISISTQNIHSLWGNVL